MSRSLLVVCLLGVSVSAAVGQSGGASWYGSEAGSRTASGERFNPSRVSCAHRTLPFGALVKVTDSRTGRHIICRINDRGPFNGRIIDLSRAAARLLGIIGRGVAHVSVERVR